LSVLLVEATDHPRFAIGESTTPEQNLRLKYLATRYDIPLLADLSSFPSILRAAIPVAAWPKCSFYYVHHEPGQAIDPDRPSEIMVQTSPWPTGPDSHVYRADDDMLLRDEAVARKVDDLPYTRCVGFEASPEDGATVILRSESGAERVLRARLVVDATGPSSFLARSMDLRLDDSPDVPMFTASVFAHFKHLGAWEVECGRRPCRSRATTRPCTTTRRGLVLGDPVRQRHHQRRLGFEAATG
jgi:FADH2 O2-dependent halogenase